MKKLFNLGFCSIILIIIVIGLTGCDNFLQPKPKTFESNENFFETEDQYIQAVNGAYARLQDWILDAHVLEEGRSDNTTFDNLLNNGVLEPLVFLDRFQNITNSQYVYNAWNSLYEGIKDANVPLYHLQNNVDNEVIEPEMANRLAGELKFLRAYFYFTAVRFWGDIPVLLEPITSGEEAFEIEQTPKDEVYEVIVQDLLDAVSDLPNSYSGSNVGRVTSGAAKTLLAKVYLNLGEHGNAESLLRELTESNQYSLLSNYSEIFDPENKNNDEIIYEVQFKEGSEGESSNFIYQFAPVGSMGDVVLAQTGDGTWGKNLPTLDLVNAYEEGDLRRDVSIGFFSREEDDTDVPYIKKWDNDTDPLEARTNNNWPLYRYSDVLLMLAEAINEQGYSSGEPFDLLNQIRDRAGLPSLSSNDVPNQDSFREALLQERRVELAFENHRWFDLLRLDDNPVESMIAHGETEKDNPTTPPSSIQPLGPDTYIVEPYMLLYPIPENELSVNPNLNQNEGY